MPRTCYTVEWVQQSLCQQNERYTRVSAHAPQSRAPERTTCDTCYQRREGGGGGGYP